MTSRSPSSLGKTLLVCGLLLLGVYAVFGQTARHGFTDFDDPDYVTSNPLVNRGLTLRGAVWAFGHSRAGNWHPLTWISHMLDCQWFGLRAGFHHAMSFSLHGVSACVLFLALRRLSKAFWLSAFVAAAFAIHPLRVESVAWVAERKDVLSGLFFFLTLLAYEGYARRGQSPGCYLLTTLFFLLGLMAKPMLVTFPFVALLLDYWPLGRFQATPSPANCESGTARSESRIRVGLRLLTEKALWILLSAVSCWITIAAQKKAISSIDRLPFALRLPNAILSYTGYLGMAAWPRGLAVFYPHTAGSYSRTLLTAAIVLLAGISLAAVALRRRSPYLLVGWMWYVVMLLPVIGLLQVGGQAMADRYTYLPLIGISIAAAGTAGEMVRRRPRARAAVAAASAVLLATWLAAAWRQTAFWCDDLTLWSRAAACTSENATTLNNLYKALFDAGFRTEAVQKSKRALELQPDCATAHYNRGLDLAMDGRMADAIAHVRTASELEPDSPKYHNTLAQMLAGRRAWRETIEHLQSALALDPDAVIVQENLAWTLATVDPREGGDPARAVALAEHVCRLVPTPAENEWDTLAAAYAAGGRFADALGAADRAWKMAQAHGNAKLLAEIRSRIQLYQAGKPYRQ